MVENKKEAEIYSLKLRRPRNNQLIKGGALMIWCSTAGQRKNQHTSVSLLLCHSTLKSPQ